MSNVVMKQDRSSKLCHKKPAFFNVSLIVTWLSEICLTSLIALF